MTSLPKRQLGKNGPQVSRLGFGLMGLSGAYGAVESTEDRLKVWIELTSSARLSGIPQM